MSLQDKFAALKGWLEGKRALVEMAGATREAPNDMTTSEPADHRLKVGDRAPDFALPDPDGWTHRLANLLTQGPLVLTFYQGAWCSCCDMDVQAIQAASGSFRNRGAGVIAISPQTATNNRKSRRDNALSFPILSDHGNNVAAAFGLRFRLPEGLIAIYKEFGHDLTLANGEASWTLPMPARYVIGRDGVIAFAEINPDHVRQPDPRRLLTVLKRLSDVAITRSEPDPAKLRTET
jgi:peroxiredoxin